MERAFFVSDLHLRGAKDPNYHLFLKFLSLVASHEAKSTHLFFVGDIFDLWVGSHSCFINEYLDLTHKVRKMVASGFKIYFFEGNHDLHLKPYWQDDLGVQVFSDFKVFDLCGLRVRVEHGDLIDPEDKGYRFLRWFLRTPPVKGLALQMPSTWAGWVGEKASRRSRVYTSESKVISESEAIEKIRAHAQICAQKEPLDLIVTGHLHVFDDFKFELGGRVCRSINLGTWLKRPGHLYLDSEGMNYVLE